MDRWENLLTLSLRAGIKEDDFWCLTMRQLDRALRVHSESVELDFMRSAIETAYMMNMVGGAAGGKKWKQVKPKDLFDEWLGKKKSYSSDFKDRWNRAMKLHNARLEREYAKRSASTLK